MRILSHKRNVEPANDSFIIKVNYASGFTVTLPLYNGTGYNYNFIVDWGDGAVGQVTYATDTDRVHNYSSGGTYTITMTGTLEGWSGNATGMKEYIIEVTQWGRTGFKGVGVSMKNCSRLTKCSGILTTSQTILAEMFYNNTSLISCETTGWDVSMVTSFGSGPSNGMFQGCTNLTSLDLSSWTLNTTSSFTMGGMFIYCSNLTTIGDVSGWNTSKCTNMSYIFYDCSKITNASVSCINSWNVTAVTNFGGMFHINPQVTDLDLSDWVINTTSTVGMSQVFNGCVNLTTIGDVSGWDTSKVYITNGFFLNCVKLTTVCANYLNSWNVTAVTDFRQMFQGCSTVVNMDLSGWVLNTISNIDLTSMFSGCSNLTTIGDVSGWNTSKCSSMGSMFSGCSKLTTIGYVSGWNVTAVTNFGSMFSGCSTITNIDLSGWILNTTSNVSLASMFIYCSNLTTIGDVSGWNTSKCTNISRLFYDCQKLTDTSANYLNNWNVTAVISFTALFQGCKTITSVNLSSWTLNTTSNIDISYFFNGCSNLVTFIFSGWNTSKATSLQQFFDGCASLTTCDVSIFNTSSVTNVSYMFRNCSSMTTINISGWDLSKVVAANMTQYMFYGCYGLTSLTLPASLPRVDNKFAVFTETPGTPAITVYNIYRATAPTVSNTPFGNYAKPLHVPVSNSGYNVAPWTNTAIFSSVTADL